MNLISYFSPAPQADEIPDNFPSPFRHQPHPLALRACRELQQRLVMLNDNQYNFHAENGGKMFGVLVVRDQKKRLGFLSAFSGMLNGSWHMDGFVPPVFDPQTRNAFLPSGEEKLAVYNERITSLRNSSARHDALEQLAQLENQYQIARSTLKQTHQHRRAMRHQTRATLNAEAHSERKQLGFESQQDKREWREINQQWQARIDSVKQQLQQIDDEIGEIAQHRTALSRNLHNRVFSGYTLGNTLGEYQPITRFFDNGLPPGGTGDCAGPKLLQHALHHQLKPVALAEFWWGAAPATGVRHHGHYYPACRGKCQPILPFMLKGQTLESAPDLDEHIDADALTTIYEDNDLVVVNKPAGLLSVPGKTLTDSVLTRLQQHYPAATGPLLLHRLDMHTSGLLLAAKNTATHKALQKQFLNRSVEKRYVALLSKHQQPPAQTTAEGKGLIELPLRVDLDDRPRQIVCTEHGKAATTHWEIINHEQQATRVYFYPVTGRTHQLRVHAAHKEGLNNPIVGDQLYGDNAERLMLHAQRLAFTHPRTGKRMTVDTDTPF